MSRHETKFIVDFMLGRLAKWLRALGYDTLYAGQHDKAGLLLQSLRENRLLVTRDHRISAKKTLRLVHIDSDLLPEQLKQIVADAHLAVSPSRFFTRCTVCNGPLSRVDDKCSIKALVPAYVYQAHDDFFRCAACGKVYWQGTHRELLLKDLAKAGIRVDNP